MVVMVIIVPAVAVADVVDLVFEGVKDTGKGIHQFVNVPRVSVDMTIASAIGGIDQVMEVMGQLIEFRNIGPEMAKGSVGIVSEAMNVISFAFDFCRIREKVAIGRGVRVVLTKLDAQIGGKILQAMRQANEVIFVTSIGVRSGEANQSKCEAGSDKCDFGRWILHGQGLSKWFRDLTRESAAYAHSAIKVEKFSFSPGELML